MNIVIFSGGTGSVAIETGLKNIFGNNAHITNIINGYDDGKSTGIVRNVFDVLGPSDIRKVQWLQWSNTFNNDRRIDEFYNNRYSFNIDTAIDIVKSWSFEYKFSYAIISSISEFFMNYGKDEVIDFNIANILYGHMFKTIGYAETIQYFSEFLGIDDNIVLNSYDNVSIGVTYNDNKECWHEYEFIDFRDKDKIINDVFFHRDKKKIEVSDIHVNEEAYKYIRKADLIIISTGTEWSSLIPTFKFSGISNEINKSGAVKIKVTNTEADGDVYGTHIDDILNVYNTMVNLSDFIILSNYDAHIDWKVKDPKFNTWGSPMDNIDGRHSVEKVTGSIIDIFLEQQGFNRSKLLFDFDDTIWRRMDKNKNISIDNLRLLNTIGSYRDVSIVSGNSYESIREKLIQTFGSNFKLNFDIWADGGFVHYYQDELIGYVPECMLSDDTSVCIEELIHSLDLEDIPKLKRRGIVGDKTACITIKPIHNSNFRELLVRYLNLLFIETGVGAVARITGFTTIDIFNKLANKSRMLEYIDSDNIIYIGDECDFELGNDYQIAKESTNFYNVNGVLETNIILKRLL